MKGQIFHMDKTGNPLKRFSWLGEKNGENSGKFNIYVCSHKRES